MSASTEDKPGEASEKHESFKVFARVRPAKERRIPPRTWRGASTSLRPSSRGRSS